MYDPQTEGGEGEGRACIKIFLALFWYGDQRVAVLKRDFWCCWNTVYGAGDSNTQH